MLPLAAGKTTVTTLRSDWLKPELPLQRVPDLQRQRMPLLGGAWRKAAERADGPLPRTIPGMDRLYQEIVIVGFSLMSFGGSADIHRPLYTL